MTCLEGSQFVDEVYGPQSFRHLQSSEFVIWRHDDWPSYQLAVVVDDHDQGISEVVRGSDLLDSTPRQISIYHAMGWTAPRFLHLPLVRDHTGQKLSKQNLAESVHQADVVSTLKRCLAALGQDTTELDAADPVDLLLQAARAWDMTALTSYAASQGPGGPLPG